MKTLVSIFVISLSFCIIAGFGGYDLKLSFIVVFLTALIAYMGHMVGPCPLKDKIDKFNKA